jgi:hypothetical protein
MNENNRVRKLKVTNQTAILVKHWSRMNVDIERRITRYSYAYKAIELPLSRFQQHRQKFRLICQPENEPDIIKKLETKSGQSFNYRPYLSAKRLQRPLKIASIDIDTKLLQWISDMLAYHIDSEVV